MTIKKTYIITTVVLSSCLLGGLYFSFNQDNTEKTLAANNTQLNQNILIEYKELKKSTSPTQPKDLTVNQLASTQHTDLPPKNTEDFLGISRRSDVAESILAEAGVTPVDLDKAAFIEFDLTALSKLEVGKSFDLEIPQTNEIFTAEVTHIEVFDNGDKHIIGNIVGLDDSLHNTVITVGKDALYGQFTTVSGNWVFESKDQYGWIAAKRDLYRSHVELEAVELTTSSATTDGVKDVFAPEKL